MANIKSAIHRIKTSKKENLRNRMHLSKMRTAIKKFQVTLEQNDYEACKKTFPQLVSVIDKTASKGVIKKQSANRYKSRINTRLKAAILSSESK